MTVPSIAQASIVKFFGEVTVRRAGDYVGSGMVADVVFDAESSSFSAWVSGTDDYEVEVTVAKRNGRWAPVRSVCSCPVSLSCKHGAALLLDLDNEDWGNSPAGMPEWEIALSALSVRSSGNAQGDFTPLALEFAVNDRVPARDAMVRVRMPGVRVDTWINTTDWMYGGPGSRFDPRQVAALTALFELSRMGPHASATSLRRTPSPLLLAALTACVEAGVLLIGPKASPLRALGQMRVALVASRGDGQAVSLAPVVEPIPLPLHSVDQSVDPAVDQAIDQAVGQNAGRQQWPLAGALLGEPAVGALVEVGDGLLGLATFERPLTTDVGRLVTDWTGPLVIPDTEVARARDTYLAAVSENIPIDNSAGVLGDTTVSGPTLVVDVALPDDASVLEVSWRWSYEVNGAVRLYPMGDVPAGIEFRDAQRSIQAGVAEAFAASPDIIDYTQGVYDGVEVALWLADVRPILETVPGVEVRIRGDAPKIRRSHSRPKVTVNVANADDSSGGIDWYDLTVGVSVDGEEVPYRDVFAALIAGRRTLLTPGGVLADLDDERFDRVRELLSEARELARPSGASVSPSGVKQNAPVKISRFQAGLIDDLTSIADEARLSEEFHARVAALTSAGKLQRQEVPGTLKAQLRPYQRDGLDWLSFLWDNSFGGVLADDMGLGKTVQALALICRAYEAAKPPSGPFLVVAPTSVVSNWAAESAKFAPHLAVAVVTETSRKAGASLSQLIDGAQIVVTSYTLLRLDAAEYASVHFSGVILDEAQFVKNPRSKAFSAVSELNRPFTLAVTGTPMENNLEELWALLSLTVPGVFPHRSRFVENYRRPIERGGDNDQLARLRRRVKPFMLRRTKDLVAQDLPEKSEIVVDIELGADHRRIYDRALTEHRARIMGLLEDVNGNRFEILRSLTLLRRLALDPSLVDDALTVDEVAKLDYLTDRLDELLAEDHNVLIFSQFTGFLGKAAAELDRRGIRYAYLDGSTTNRAEVIEKFTAGEVSVFLISLKAGGFGLNLVQADYCFLLDPWWNPAAEAQAIDRAHRIGQTRPVVVYRLVVNETIETKVMELKERKAALFASVLGGDATFGTRLEASDIRALFAADD